MVEYNGVPEVARDLSCKSETRAVEPDVIVDVKDGEQWVRLPTTVVEVFMTKDGPSDLTRTGKVKIPGEWGDESIIQYINGFNAQNDEPYDECRIYFRDHDDGVYDIVHYGYVGGVGPATENGVFKFWVYDPADLMRGIQVSKSFDQPTIQQILHFALDGTDDNGNEVGLKQRSVFDNIQTTISGLQEVAIQKADKRQGVFGGITDTEGSEGFEPPDTGGGLLSGIADFFDDAWDVLTEVGDDILGGGRKRFQLNRHNMVDLMNWFADEVGGKWHFEPSDSGPILFFDNTAERNPEAEGTEGQSIIRRLFVASEIEDEDDVQPISIDDGSEGGVSFAVFDRLDQLENDALYDIKPFNTLYLYGESSTPQQRQPQGTAYSSASAPGGYTSEFPYVKLTYPPLVDRAGGYEYAPEAIESDKIYLSNAEKEAKKQFRKNLEEETEGSIETKGNPHILPYDYFKTIPVCNDIYANINADPLTYEVNGVKHRRAAGERYTTELNVSLIFKEAKLEVTAEMREA